MKWASPATTTTLLWLWRRGRTEATHLNLRRILTKVCTTWWERRKAPSWGDRTSSSLRSGITSLSNPKEEYLIYSTRIPLSKRWAKLIASMPSRASCLATATRIQTESSTSSQESYSKQWWRLGAWEWLRPSPPKPLKSSESTPLRLPRVRARMSRLEVFSPTTAVCWKPVHLKKSSTISSFIGWMWVELFVKRMSWMWREEPICLRLRRTWFSRINDQAHISPNSPVEDFALSSLKPWRPQH